MLNAKEESLNEELKVKDPIFANCQFSGYNQSYNRGKDRGNYNNRGGRGGRGSNG